MVAKLEWADIECCSEVLYPGVDVDGAVVAPGQVAIAWWTGSNGVALCAASPAAAAEYFERLAARLQVLPPPPAEEAHIAAVLNHADRTRVRDAVLRALTRLLRRSPRPVSGKADVRTVGLALCGDTGPAVIDPRQATCAECLSTWSEQAAGPPRLSVSLVYPLT